MTSRKGYVERSVSAYKIVDDVQVGEIVLDDQTVQQVLSEASVEVTVLDVTVKTEGTVTPCRITVLHENGALATLGAKTSGQIAVRPGVIYSGNGQAKFGLPAGTYTIYAGRGFEYGIDCIRVTVKAGDSVKKTLSIVREVPTKGFVSCDPHVHTLTYSGHGDCTEDERMLTIAGEGIELPIATDHNRQIDYQDAAVRMGLRQYFTPVVGNEVTTSVGHFNVFPLIAKGPLPDHKLKDWKSLFANILDDHSAKIVILNHARDIHSTFRPFGPERHMALTGSNLDGWELRANAMEVVNSGAQQTDEMFLVRDWFGMLNRGITLTPVGSSDSHDVSRYIVGQGRTYIRCKDDVPGEIDINEAVDKFRQGRVMVSCGLLTEITVNGKYGPGDLVPEKSEHEVFVRVLGPSWVEADKVELYANGIKIREAAIASKRKAGVKWEGTWKLSKFTHDVHLVAVATGPSVMELYWPIVKPYQPTSPMLKRRVIGMTGAVWLDCDGDGRKSNACGYARKLFDANETKLPLLMASLANCDEAIAVQVASLMQAKKISLNDPAIQEGVKKAGPHVERAFQAFAAAWRESQIARSELK